MELGTVALIGMILLGIALAFGIYQNNHRNKRRDPQTDAATREMYDQDPEGESTSGKA